MTLQNKTFRAVRWTAAGTITKALLQIGQIAVLARVLSPEDYGLMAVVMVILSFASIFSDFGVNSAFIQRRDVSEQQRTSLFWFNVFVSCGLMLLVISISPWLSGLFKDDRLTLLIILSCATFLIGALGLQVRMAAEKALLFRGVMCIEVFASLLGSLAAVLTALAGWGVYSLVFGANVSAFFCTLLLWLFLSQGWRPDLKFSFTDVHSFLGFGGALVANNVVNQINLSIDLVLGGRMLAATQLGFYSIPRDLVLRIQGVVNPIVTRISFPLIAEVQSEMDRVRGIYLQVVNITASANAPIYVAVVFFANDVVAVLLGDDWEASVQILQVLAIWGAFRSIGNPIGSLLLGSGRADLSLKWNFGLLFITPPIVWFGSLYGPQGMSVALLFLSILLFVPGWYFLVKPLCEATLIEYSVTALRPMLLSSIAILPAFLICGHFEEPWIRLLFGLMIAAPNYLVLTYWLNRESVLLLWGFVGRLPK